MATRELEVPALPARRVSVHTLSGAWSLTIESSAHVATRSSFAAGGDSCSSQRAPLSIRTSAASATINVAQRMPGVGFDEGLRR